MTDTLPMRTDHCGTLRPDESEVVEAGFFASPPAPLHPPTEVVLRLHAVYRETGLFQAC